MVIAPADITDLLRAELPKYGHVGRSKLKVYGQMDFFYVSAKELARLHQNPQVAYDLFQAHHSLIDVSAAVRGTSFARSHSPGLIEYVRQVLVPDR